MIDNGYWESDTYIDGIQPVNAGNILAKKGRTIDRPHGRPDYLLFYVADGEERFTFADGTVAVAGPGTILLYAPGERQSHVCVSEGIAHFHYVHFYLCDPEPWLSVLGMETSRLYRCPSASRLADTFESIVEELQTKRPFYQEIVIARMKELFFLVRRKIHQEEADANTQDKLISRMIREINKTYPEPLTLEDYARRFELSKYYFLHLFRDSTGVSPIAYRNSLRLRHAKEMLEEGNTAITEVAEVTGFSSVNYFSDCFRKEYGLSPTEWRIRCRS